MSNKIPWCIIYKQIGPIFFLIKSFLCIKLCVVPWSRNWDLSILKILEGTPSNVLGSKEFNRTYVYNSNEPNPKILKNFNIRADTEIDRHFENIINICSGYLKICKFVKTTRMFFFLLKWKEISYFCRRS